MFVQGAREDFLRVLEIQLDIGKPCVTCTGVLSICLNRNPLGVIWICELNPFVTEFPLLADMSGPDLG